MSSRFVLPYADVGNGIDNHSGAKLFFYQTGTSTPRNTYSDEALTIPNANPVIADAEGVFPDIWIDDEYKVILQDSKGTQIWEADPVKPGGGSSSSVFDSVADMQAFSALAEGDIVWTAGYYAPGDGGGNQYLIVPNGTGTDDGGSYINLSGSGLQAQGLFPGEESVKQFGARGDGSTDDSAAVNASLAARPNAYLRGGTAGFLIDSASITIPIGKALIADYVFIDPRNGALFNDTNYPNRIILNPTYSIVLRESSSANGLAVIAKDVTWPQYAADVATWSGAAFRTTPSESGMYFGHCAILGFNTAIADDTSSNTENIRCEYLNIDCANGVLMEQNFDVVYIENCHCWPTLSIGAPGFVDADLQRPGTGFQFKNGGDWNKWTTSFTYGYARGFVVDACNSVTIFGCGADYTATQTVLPIGYSVQGASGETRIVSCQAAGQNVGIYINTSSTSGATQITGFNGWENDAHHILIDDGPTMITGGVCRGGIGHGVTHNTPDPLSIIGTYFKSIALNSIRNVVATYVLRHSDCVFDAVTGNPVINPYKPTIASADPLVLNGIDTVWEVTGTTGFGTLSRPADYAGKTVALKFTGALTVINGGSMNLAGNFVATSADVLTLASDGTSWYEVSRSVN